jgi:hypothetical protein
MSFYQRLLCKFQATFHLTLDGSVSYRLQDDGLGLFIYFLTHIRLLFNIVHFKTRDTLQFLCLLSRYFVNIHLFDFTHAFFIVKLHRSYLSCHRCFIFMGDIARYHKDIRPEIGDTTSPVCILIIHGLSSTCSCTSLLAYFLC